MNYYHLRFNVYEQSGFPVEKETWVNFNEAHDESRIKEYLEVKHHKKISLILCKEICLEEFEVVHSATA